MTLVQITSRYFTASVLVAADGKVADAAPILAYMKGWQLSDVKTYAMFKGWGIEIVVPSDTREYGKTTVSVPQPSGG